jgi:hypothetical protein
MSRSGLTRRDAGTRRDRRDAEDDESREHGHEHDRDDRCGVGRSQRLRSGSTSSTGSSG